jgi:predicted RNase H-like HicB family nuclease
MPHTCALIHLSESGSYGISFPDFPGCVSGGNSAEEAIRKGQEALAFHVAGMAEDGDPLPELRSLDQLRADAEFVEAAEDAMVALVPVDLPGKAVRINLSIDDRLLERLDRAATAAGQSRSAFVADAVRKRMAG